MPDRAMLTLIIIAFGERWLVVPSRAGTEVSVPGRAGSGSYRGGMSVSLADGSVVLLWHDAICANRDLTRKCLGFHSDTLFVFQ